MKSTPEKLAGRKSLIFNLVTRVVGIVNKKLQIHLAGAFSEIPRNFFVKSQIRVISEDLVECGIVLQERRILLILVLIELLNNAITQTENWWLFRQNPSICNRTRQHSPFLIKVAISFELFSRNLHSTILSSAFVL
jgi:hypothetical protein